MCISRARSMRNLELLSHRATKADAKAIAQSIFFEKEHNDGEIISWHSQGEERYHDPAAMDEDSNQIETMTIERFTNDSCPKLNSGDEDEDEETSLIRLCGGRDDYEKLMIDIQNELDGERAEENSKIDVVWKEASDQESDYELQNYEYMFDEPDEIVFGESLEEGPSNDEDTLVCPYCKTGTMRLSHESVICGCGKSIPLRQHGSSPTLLSVYDLKRALAQAYER